ncbi:conserved hypothetical protein [Trichinella spiralis]|uniref:hypothetical protein n=1 Tax=Trichinella spiralis TaxID=6334 RepID=UPI0001EFD9EB|nr:conserved hypothetical protein [Trichinella spiralis]
MQADRIRNEYTFVLFDNGQSEERTPSTAANRQSICNRNKQRHENSMITRKTAISTDFGVYRYPSLLLRGALHGPIYRARGRRPKAGSSLEPPMSSPLTAGELAIAGADLNHRRLPIKLS